MKLIELPTEILVQIVNEVAPRSLTSHRAKLILLTQSCTILADLARKRLFSKVSVIITEEESFLEILEGIKLNPIHLKIKAPENTISSDDDPIAALIPIVPASRSQQETVGIITIILNECTRIKNLVIETPVGTIEEGKEIKVTSVALDSLTESLKKLTLHSYSIAIVDRNQRLAVMATDGFISPFIHAAQTWNHLTRLDLWRVSVNIPLDFPEPTFQLVDLILVESQLNSERELNWLLGSRTSNLISLEIRSVNFITTPYNSDPMKSIFNSSFSNLEELTLELVYPILDAHNLLKSFTSLTSVRLGGNGTTPEIFNSLFSTSTITPLKSLELCATTDIEIDSIIKTLNNSLHSKPLLKDLTIWTFGTFASQLGLAKGQDQLVDVALQWNWSEKQLKELNLALRNREDFTLKVDRVTVELLAEEDDEEEEENENENTEESSGSEREDSIFVPTSDVEQYINFTRGGESEEESDY